MITVLPFRLIIFSRVIKWTFYQPQVRITVVGSCLANSVQIRNDSLDRPHFMGFIIICYQYRNTSIILNREF